MNLPKADMNTKEAYSLWLSEKSDYAKEQVILSTVPMCYITMKKLNIYDYDDDLLMIGVEAILKAMDKFDPDKGFEFITYATSCIRSRYLHYIRDYVQKNNYCYLEDDEARSFKESCSRHNTEEEAIINVQISKLLSNYTEKQRKAIQLHMDGITQQKIANILDVSQSYASRLINRFKTDLAAMNRI